MEYERVLAELCRIFGDRPFTVREATVHLGYGGPAGRTKQNAVGDWGSTAWSGTRLRAAEKARQHAKSDIRRIHKWGLLRGAPVGEGGPGRRPHAYTVTRRGKRYFEWMRGQGLIDAFQDFLSAAPGDCVLPGERLARRLRALEGWEVDRTTLKLIELHLDELMREPTPDARSRASQTFASAIRTATKDAPTEIKLRVHRVVFPHLVGGNAATPRPARETGPDSVVEGAMARLRQEIVAAVLRERQEPPPFVELRVGVPERGPDGKPILRNGALRSRTVAVRMKREDAALLLRRTRRGDAFDFSELMPVLERIAEADAAAERKRADSAEPRSGADPRSAREEEQTVATQLRFQYEALRTQFERERQDLLQRFSSLGPEDQRKILLEWIERGLLSGRDVEGLRSSLLRGGIPS